MVLYTWKKRMVSLGLRGGERSHWIQQGSDPLWREGETGMTHPDLRLVLEGQLGAPGVVSWVAQPFPSQGWSWWAGGGASQSPGDCGYQVGRGWYWKMCQHRLGTQPGLRCESQASSQGEMMIGVKQGNGLDTQGRSPQRERWQGRIQQQLAQVKIPNMWTGTMHGSRGKQRGLSCLGITWAFDPRMLDPRKSWQCNKALGQPGSPVAMVSLPRLAVWIHAQLPQGAGQWLWCISHLF